MIATTVLPAGTPADTAAAVAAWDKLRAEHEEVSARLEQAEIVMLDLERRDAGKVLVRDLREGDCFDYFGHVHTVRRVNTFPGAEGTWYHEVTAFRDDQAPPLTRSFPIGAAVKVL